MHAFQIFQAEFVGPKGAVVLTRLLHEKLLLELTYLDRVNALSRASVTVKALEYSAEPRPGERIFPAIYY